MDPLPSSATEAAPKKNIAKPGSLRGENSQVMRIPSGKTSGTQ